MGPRPNCAVSASGMCSGAAPVSSTKSILLTTSTTGLRASASRSAIQRSRPVTPAPPSTTNNSTSTSGMTLRASRVMYSPRRCLGLCRPGVSTNTTWASPRVSTAWIRWRVVWGLSETIATFSPTRPLTSVDLPTLGRPIERGESGTKRLLTHGPPRRVRPPAVQTRRGAVPAPS